ncbi:MAG: hypothetical protein NTV86_00925 [Planctomycetota bacterium]|nr:hypothetical protein [Planctomycetota bacterium]
MAGKDVRRAVQKDCEHLPRTLAGYPPGSATAAIWLRYLPSEEGHDLRQRLSVFLLGQAHQEEVASSLSILLGCGLFRRFYDLKVFDNEVLVPWSSFGATCDVVRRQTMIEPTVTGEHNAYALPTYHAIRSLQPSQDNDYLRLDRALSQLKEPALVEICVEATDIHRELSAHARYLSRLQQVNRTWDCDEDDLPDETVGDGSDETRQSYRSLKPLRVRDPLADEILRQARRFHETLSMPHLQFHIRVFAASTPVARLLASIVAESAFDEGSYQLFDSVRGEEFFASALHAHSPLHALATPISKQLLGQRNLRLYDGLWRLANMAPVDELTSVFRFPLASYGSPCCIRKNTDPPVVDKDALVVLGHDVQIDADDPKAPSHRVPLGIRVCDLPKGVFIGGMPGQGKTTEVLNVLIQLAQRNISFLVLEPVKTEYRIIKCLKQHPDPEVRQLAANLLLCTPGEDGISPFRINPLIRPEGITLDEHIENVAMCFDAAFPMEGPMRLILKEALEEVYEDPPNNAPRMADLAVAARKVLASKKYSGEVDSNLRAAIGLRLGSLTRGAIGRIFDCGQDVPTIPQLLTGWSIIELAALPRDQASLLTLFVLTRLREEVRVTPMVGGDVRHLLVLEEAHNLVGRERASSANEANAAPEAHASDFICRMLVEFRALAVGIAIVDQFCSAVAPEVSKSTAAKVTFRQVTRGEREEVGDMMLCGPMEKQELARLRTGEAFIFTEGYFGPRRIQTPNLQADLGLPPWPLGKDILPHLVQDPWFIQAARIRIASEMNQLRTEMDKFEDIRIQVIADLKRLLAERPGVIARGSATERLTGLASLCRKARVLRTRLESSFKAFRRFGYRPAMCECPRGTPLDEGIQALRDDLAHRFETVVSPGTEAVLKKLDDLIHECQSPPT